MCRTILVTLAMCAVFTTLLGARPAVAQEATTMAKAASPGFPLWVESSMLRVMPGDLPRPTAALARPAARLALAGGERESFQIVLRPESGLEGVRLEFSDLTSAVTGAKLGAEHLAWHQVGYVRVVDTPVKGPAPVPWLEPGWYPDPLLPVEDCKIPAQFTQPLWVTVHAPPGTRAGTYAGTVVLHADGQPDRTVPLRVKVYGFSLAPGAGHLRTAFALFDEEVRRIYASEVRSSSGEEAMVRKYRDYVLDELRLNPLNIWAEAPPPADELERLHAKGLNSFALCYLKDDKESTPWPFAPSPKAVRAQLAALEPTIDELKQRGLLDLTYIFGGDEVPQDPPERIAQVKEAFAIVKAMCPNIPLMTTAHIPQDVESLRSYHLDALCPMWDWGQFDRLEAFREQGLQMWSYISLQPYPPFPNWRLDNRLMEARTIFWQVYHQKFDAFLYWALNLWQTPPQTKLIDPAAGALLDWSITTEPGGKDLGWLHGDGRMLYAGKDGPIGSIRLANIRDGLEDYEYLWLLAERLNDREAARAACKPVACGLDKATRSPQTLYRQRESIARRIIGE